MNTIIINDDNSNIIKVPSRESSTNIMKDLRYKIKFCFIKCSLFKELEFIKILIKREKEG